MLVNLDIITIDNLEEFKSNIKNISKSKTNILYSNIVSNIVIGNRQLLAQYDKVLYTEELLILFRKEKVPKKYIINKLEENNIEYHEVIFDDEQKVKLGNKEEKEIVFVRGKASLVKTLKESKEKNIDTATVYPNASGWMDLRYYVKSGNKVHLDNISIKYSIELEDKYIFIVSTQEKRNLDLKRTINILNNEAFSIIINKEKNLIVHEEIQYIKKV